MQGHTTKFMSVTYALRYDPRYQKSCFLSVSDFCLPLPLSEIHVFSPVAIPL